MTGPEKLAEILEQFEEILTNIDSIQNGLLKRIDEIMLEMDNVKNNTEISPQKKEKELKKLEQKKQKLEEKGKEKVEKMQKNAQEWKRLQEEALTQSILDLAQAKALALMGL